MVTECQADNQAETVFEDGKIFQNLLINDTDLYMQKPQLIPTKDDKKESTQTLCQ